MFTFQNWKVKLAYAGFGCLFGSLCTIMGMLASDVAAQRDRFGDDGYFERIFCTDLLVSGKDGGGLGLALTGDEHGGRVYVYGKNRIPIPKVSLGVTEHGGYIQVKGKGEAVMSINEHGNGAITTWDKDGNKQ